MADEVEQMAYMGADPWHVIYGTNSVKVTEELTVEEFRKKAGLDWKVKPRPLYIRVGKDLVKIDDRVAYVRETDGQYLTNAGADWKHIQNEEVFDCFHKAVMENHLEMHTGGSLKNGRYTWMLARLKSGFSLFEKKDHVESYLLLTNPHVYGKPVDGRHTAVRVVCKNTLSEALNTSAINGRAIRITHRKPFDKTILEDWILTAARQLSGYKEAAEFLGTRRYNPETLRQYFSGLWRPTEKQVEEGKLHRNAQGAMDVMESQPGAELGEGSWWQAFNAATYYVDHKIAAKDDEQRVFNALYAAGNKTGAGLKQRALAEAVQFAQAS